MRSHDPRSSSSPPLDVLHGNHLLAMLPEAERAHLRPLLTQVHVDHHTLLYTMDEPISHVWFPLDAVVSLMTVLHDGTSIEMAVVGNEGVVGLPLFLGLDTDPHMAQGQVSGEVLEMEAEVFRAAAAELPGLHSVLHRYVQALYIQLGQGTACIARHALNERCARWLLEAHDRVRRDQFSLTQDFLATMLGVRRPSVTLAAGMLQQAGLIRYQRGRVTILDRAGLEASACECYWFIAEHIARVLETGRRPSASGR